MYISQFVCEVCFYSMNEMQVSNILSWSMIWLFMVIIIIKVTITVEDVNIYFSEILKVNVFCQGPYLNENTWMDPFG